jgi:hypothetical protein
MSEKKPRLRGANFTTVINAAAKAAAKSGLQVAGAIVRPGGVIELKFAQNSTPEPAADVDGWERDYGEARS